MFTSRELDLERMAQIQFDRVADLLNLDQATADLLRTNLREYHLSVPARMDDGTVKVSRGFRVQHNDARSPAKRRALHVHRLG
jgi:glutamate dehydrogenase (NAD(P)+)